MIKDLYVNGCSFTSGHHLPDEKTWPFILSKKLNLNLKNYATNGQSFDSIFLNTINHLSSLNSKETFVVIGSTFPPRYGIQFNNITTNITPPDLGVKRKDNLFYDKLNRYRRLASPYTTDKNKIESFSKNYYPTSKDTNKTEKAIGFDEVCASFVNYYNSLVKWDDNLEMNQYLNVITKIVSLQGFLEKNNFKYLIVDFFNIKRYKEENKEIWNLPINKKLDEEKIIYFDSKWKDKYVNGHPNEEGSYNISEVLYNEIKDTI